MGAKLGKIFNKHKKNIKTLFFIKKSYIWR